MQADGFGETATLDEDVLGSSEPGVVTHISTVSGAIEQCDPSLIITV